MSKLGLLFHTVRHLRPIQVAYRMRRLVRVRVRADGPTPARRKPVADLVAGPEKRQSMYSPQRFVFLNEERQLQFPHAWHDREVAALWQYNLHYFDDLNATGASERSGWHEALVGQWIADNPTGQGIGWDPYPTSLRIVNWIKWDLRTGSLNAEARSSLASQARWLRRNLEYHLLANHLLANFKALLFAGLYFEGVEADGWLETGLNGLRTQLEEQVLEDGGHFERSPMYHTIILEDVLDGIALLRVYGQEVPDGWEEIVRRMLTWLGGMTHPDGEISFFNDAALGIAPSLDALRKYAVRLALPAPTEAEENIVFTESGFARVSKGDAMLFCEVGTPGPSYQPGHAHAGTLSFEMSLFGRRLIVNSGISEYGTSSERARQRGTAAHNTVVIDEKDSSEVWSGFRVARRARVSDLEMQKKSGSVEIRASHDGYRRIYGGPVHQRIWSLSEGQLMVTDQLQGKGNSGSLIPFHLHPDVKIISAAPEQIVLDHHGERVIVRTQSQAGIIIEDTTYHPEFGKSQPSKRLVVRERRGLPFQSSIGFSWSVR